MKALAFLALAAGAALWGERDPVERPREAGVVFVCAHGNVKSLIASRWFNRLAAERGVAARSIARGLTPENPVPAPVAERLRRDGIDVAGYEARPLTAADLDGAIELVLIGVEAPPWARRDAVKVETWDGI